MRDIKEGDKIIVCWSDPKCFEIEVIVENTPSDVGDLWYLRKANGDIIALNPLSSGFECFVKKAIQ